MANELDANQETILVVDDEEPVRRTFRDWLSSANLQCRVLAAADAKSALTLADQHQIDLAILDWNLGAGQDGLQLLQDLTIFNPDIVAIMVTGFANRATPLLALRMGVRDYLDKNHDLTRETFLAAVIKQLERIRPARRERQLREALLRFRSAVERILPLVQTATALHDPLPLTAAIRALFAFLLRATQASDGVLLVHSYDRSREVAEDFRAYDATGKPLPVPTVPFAQSLAAQVISLQETGIFSDPRRLAQDIGITLLPCEAQRRIILAGPVQVVPGVQVVLELFDPPSGDFSSRDRLLISAAGEFAGELLRQGVAEQQAQRLLGEALTAAAHITEHVGGSMSLEAQQPPPPELLAPLRRELAHPDSPLDADATLQLAEAIRQLALKFGPTAVQFCRQQIEATSKLLGELTGEELSR
jgi:DNA-binding response OmpR family regulator